MPDTRTLPIPEGHREFTVKTAGAKVDRANQLLAAAIVKSANKISSARLIYLDGTAAKGDFPLSDAGTFVPGTEVEILAGPENNPVSLFKGIVIRQSLKVRDHTAPQLVVECRHASVKLSVGRKNAYYANQKDSDIISTLLGNAGLAADVEATSVTHKQQVQYDCTDWDYVLMRAEASGKLVFTNGNTVSVKAPVFSGTPVCTLQYGATILELDAEMDSRLQYSAVKSFTWDPAQQQVTEKDAVDPQAIGPGNLAPSDLAAVIGLDHWQLQHVAITDQEAQVWANSVWLRSQMDKICGRIKCEGMASVNPGDIVTLAGLGDRFNGNAFVTGVRHDLDLVQGWKTHVQFGSVDQLPADTGVTAPQASALLPAVHGLQTGVVVSNEDPDDEDRVQVRMPLVSNNDDGTWARVASLDAGDNRGCFFRPEIGDEVVLGFLNDDPRQAVILGMLNSSAKPAPLKGSNGNNEKVYQSRSQMKIYFNDDQKVMQFETPAGNKITLSEHDQAVTLEDQNGNKIEMNQNGITIQSTQALELKAGTELKLESGTSLTAQGGTDLTLQGTSSAEISSTATTSVKGSLVQLN